MSSMLEAALEYAAKGWPVFPCLPKGKAPLTPHGFKDASKSPEQINSWWSRWPMANIGFAIPRDSIVVIDIDPRNGGKVFEELKNHSDTLICNTGGGGYHYYYKLPAKSNNLRSKLATGIDVKSAGGYVLLPPSCTEAEYIWSHPDFVPKALPPELEQLITKPDIPHIVSSSYYDDPTDMRPGSVYNRTANWRDILEPAGWKVVGSNGDELFWCRPGKHYGISATTNYASTDLLYVFSSSSNLEPGAHTKFSVYTTLYFNGDFADAARSLQHAVEDKSPITSSAQQSYAVTAMPYKFEPAFGSEHFVTKYCEYVAKQTDAPLEYAEASALVLLSLAGYQCKANLAPYPGGLANNLYTVLVGPTTRSRKSTVQRITGNIIKKVMPPSLLPNRATTEALIKALSNRNGVPSVWTPDEFGVTLAEIYNRDYMRGLEEMLLTVYSGDDYEYQRVLDSVLIKSPHLSVLGAATPESIARAGTTALDSGLLPRFAVVFPMSLPDSKVVSEAADLRFEQSYFVNRLNKIVTWAQANQQITFHSDALAALNTAEEALTATSAARLPTMLYKVASLSAISREQAAVTLSDAESAVRVVTRWAEGMANLIPQMYRHGTDQQFEQQLDYVLSTIQTAGGELLRVHIANLINVKKQRLDELESTLVDKGRIRVETGAGGKKWILL